MFEIAETIYRHPEMHCYMTSMDEGFVYTDDPSFIDFFNENVLRGSQHLKSLKDLWFKASD